MAEKNDATVAVVERLPFHILFTKLLTIYENWREWLAVWSECQNTFQLISLLHDGFSVSMEMSQYGEDSEGRYRSDLPIYDGIDRLVLYFAVAEGWINPNLLHKPGDGNGTFWLGYDNNGRRIEKSIVELRQMVSAKAFEMLASNLFNVKDVPERVDRDKDFSHVWYAVTSERLFPHVMSFFRVQERYAFHPGEDFEMPNLRQAGRFSTISNSEKVATEFLLNLARFIWRWGPGERPWFGEKEDEKRQKWEASVKTTHTRLDQAKPWMIEVLAQLGRLDILREWLLELDKACLAKLKEIAFRNKLYKYEREDERNVETLEEACFLGSPSAWLLMEYAVKKKESDRLSKIRDAKRKKKEADRELAELSGKKK